MPEIYEKLLEKCKAASVGNYGAYPKTLATHVIREDGTDAKYTPYLNATKVTLYTGNKTFTLEVKDIPDGTEVAYESDDTAVATVSDEGLITRKTAGECEVTATVTVEGREWVLKCAVTCSSDVARVGTTDYATTAEAAAVAMETDDYLIPLGASISYTFGADEKTLKVKSVYSGASITVNAPADTAEYTYAVTTETVGTDVTIYTLVATPVGG